MENYMSKTTKPMPKLLVTKFTELSIKEYIEKLDEIEYSNPSDQPVIIQIDSYGGSVTGLFMLLDRLETMPQPIVTYCSSKAMSAGAFLLAIAGDKGMRFASKDASILVHEVQTGSTGDIKNVEDDLVYTKWLNDTLLDRFAQSIGLKNSASIRRLIARKAIGHDLILTAQEALKLKIIDEIASISLTPYSGWEIRKKIK